jgi:hypothetical protein
MKCAGHWAEEMETAREIEVLSVVYTPGFNRNIAGCERLMYSLYSFSTWAGLI